MRYFLVVLLITCAGFGNSFYILAKNTSEPFIGDSYFRGFFYSYNLALGDFNTDDFDEEDQNLLKLLWFCNTLVTLIVFLNLLISIISDTFDKVKETEESNMLKELALIMSENEILVDRSKVFEHAKYIIVITKDTPEQESYSWDGRLNRIKSFLEQDTEFQKKAWLNLEKHIITELNIQANKFAIQMGKSSTKLIHSLEEKLDSFEKMIKDFKKQGK